MALNNVKLNNEFKNLFESFKEKHSELEKIIESKGRRQIDIINPRALRLFRIRLRLVLGMKVDFDGTYSLTKDEKVRETYIQIIKCNEAWFAYESLELFADSTDKIARPSPNKKAAFSEISQDTFDNKYQTSSILKIFNEELKEWVQKGRSGKRKDNVKDYLIDLSNVMYPGATSLKTYLTDFAQKIESGIEVNDLNIEVNDLNILAMAYATRNVFVHKGESAFFGKITYSNKQDLLGLAYDYIVLLMLKAILYYYDKQIVAHR